MSTPTPPALAYLISTMADHAAAIRDTVRDIDGHPAVENADMERISVTTDNLVKLIDEAYLLTQSQNSEQP